MAKTNGVNLSFSDQLPHALNNASVIFLALPTPTKNFGEKKGKAYDLSYTEDAIRSIVKYYNEHPMLDNVILVEKSTVPIGTARMITSIIEAVSIKSNIRKYVVTSNP
jgi:UDPglucose 6-dehydrogenase